MVVDADGVVAEGGEVRGDRLGLVLVGEVGAAADVDAPEADRLAGTALELEVPVAHHDAPVHTARRVRGRDPREVERRARLNVALRGEGNPGRDGGGAAVAQ